MRLDRRGLPVRRHLRRVTATSDARDDCVDAAQLVVPLEHQGRAAGRRPLSGVGERSMVAHAAARFRIDAFSPMVRR
jgi:hypothetical protein